jgi:hypothetical protein
LRNQTNSDNHSLIATMEISLTNPKLAIKKFKKFKK